jgi:hypothetical protein
MKRYCHTHYDETDPVSKSCSKERRKKEWNNKRKKERRKEITNVRKRKEELKTDRQDRTRQTDR